MVFEAGAFRRGPGNGSGEKNSKTTGIHYEKIEFIFLIFPPKIGRLGAIRRRTFFTTFPGFAAFRIASGLPAFLRFTVAVRRAQNGFRLLRRAGRFLFR